MPKHTIELIFETIYEIFVIRSEILSTLDTVNKVTEEEHKIYHERLKSGKDNLKQIFLKAVLKEETSTLEGFINGLKDPKFINFFTGEGFRRILKKNGDRTTGLKKKGNYDRQDLSKKDNNAKKIDSDGENHKTISS